MPSLSATYRQASFYITLNITNPRKHYKIYSNQYVTYELKQIMVPAEYSGSRCRHRHALIYEQYRQSTYQLVTVNRHILYVSLCVSQKLTGNGKDLQILIVISAGIVTARR